MYGPSLSTLTVRTRAPSVPLAAHLTRHSGIQRREGEGDAQMNQSRTRLSSTQPSNSLWRSTSRDIVSLRRLRSSIDTAPCGPSFTTPGLKHRANFSACSGGTGLEGFRTTSGCRRYDAVATDTRVEIRCEYSECGRRIGRADAPTALHFACSFPRPLTACSSISMICSGANFARTMSLFVAAGGFAAKTVSCSPCGSQTRSAVVTTWLMICGASFAAFFTRSHLTLSL